MLEPKRAIASRSPRVKSKVAETLGNPLNKVEINTQIEYEIVLTDGIQNQKYQKT